MNIRPSFENKIMHYRLFAYGLDRGLGFFMQVQVQVNQNWTGVWLESKSRLEYYKSDSK